MNIRLIFLFVFLFFFVLVWVGGYKNLFVKGDFYILVFENVNVCFFFDMYFDNYNEVDGMGVYYLVNGCIILKKIIFFEYK